jgi:hypothetical protein
MFVEIIHMTPWCLKQLPNDEYTAESRLPCGEYTSGLDSPVVNTPGSLDFLVYLVLASELVYKIK